MINLQKDCVPRRKTVRLKPANARMGRDLTWTATALKWKHPKRRVWSRKSLPHGIHKWVLIFTRPMEPGTRIHWPGRPVTSTPANPPRTIIQMMWCFPPSPKKYRKNTVSFLVRMVISTQGRDGRLRISILTTTIRGTLLTSSGCVTAWPSWVRHFHTNAFTSVFTAPTLLFLRSWTIVINTAKRSHRSTAMQSWQRLRIFLTMQGEQKKACGSKWCRRQKNSMVSEHTTIHLSQNPMAQKRCWRKEIL